MKRLWCSLFHPRPALLDYFCAETGRGFYHCQKCGLMWLAAQEKWK